MIDPTPYLNSLIFFVEFRPAGELFTTAATVYHETKQTIKNYIKIIEIRNGWECVSIKYKDMKSGILKSYNLEELKK